MVAQFQHKEREENKQTDTINRYINAHKKEHEHESENMNSENTPYEQIQRSGRLESMTWGGIVGECCWIHTKCCLVPSGSRFQKEGKTQLVGNKCTSIAL